eukprot:TRINITY_DN67011_c3_g10_i1.p1 TRINITY_DN67011_c3_g10~~TRINITY_DN67011_c3_g10_i1.p1  ORF type:complete len:374 (-),score=26.47 TRINITY_DN67011_c3_g10_i1:792-1913(-)
MTNTNESSSSNSVHVSQPLPRTPSLPMHMLKPVQGSASDQAKLELYETEKIYNTALDLFVAAVDNLQTNKHLPDETLTLFQPIRGILMHSTKLLKHLTEALKPKDIISSDADLTTALNILMHCVSVYAKYIARVPQLMTSFLNHLETTPEVKAKFELLRADAARLIPSTDATLLSLLAMPGQRLTRYCDLLKSLVAKSPRCSPFQDQLTNLASRVQQLNDGVDSARRVVRTGRLKIRRGSIIVKDVDCDVELSRSAVKIQYERPPSPLQRRPSTEEEKEKRRRVKVVPVDSIRSFSKDADPTVLHMNYLGDVRSRSRSPNSSSTFLSQMRSVSSTNNKKEHVTLVAASEEEKGSWEADIAAQCRGYRNFIPMT